MSIRLATETDCRNLPVTRFGDLALSRRVKSSNAAVTKRVGEDLMTIYDQEGAELAPLPGSRMLARILGEMQIAFGVEVLAVLQHHLCRHVPFDRAIYLMIIMRASDRFRASSTGVASPSRNASDGISINAIATSLNRPFETVRRHVNWLIADGLCERGPCGVIPRRETFERPEFRALLRRLHDRVVGMIEDIKTFGVILPKTHEAQYNPDATIAAGMDLTLATYEIFAENYCDWLELLIVNAVALASVRRITFDPIMAPRYGHLDTVPPEALRELVTIASVARALHLSYSSVRREVLASVKSGKLVRIGGGLRASTAYLEAIPTSRGSQLTAVRAFTVLQRLAPGGFRFDNPAASYLDGKPPALNYSG